jgi:4-hydroxy-tetrahydrodipicolinate synthase
MRGVWTALVTPFSERNELDLGAFRRILEDQRSAGVAGVIPCGTTGESPTLTIDEKKTLIKAAVETLKGSGVKVAAGTGSNDTSTTVALSRWASSEGVDAVLVVTPYYSKPSQAGMEAHFRAVADAVTCEVMLYNVPGRTGVSLAPATVASLASHPQITTLKEASGNVALSSEILDSVAQARRKMDLLSGDDAVFLPLLSVGACGVVSVSSNLFPRNMVAIQSAFEKGDVRLARELHQKFFPLFRDLFIESNPVPIKYAMAFAGWCSAAVRAPLAAMASDNSARLDVSLRACGISKGASL